MTEWVKANPHCALFVDMGYGKTVAYLTALLELQDTLDAGATLIVATLKVCQYTWPDEIAGWTHTRKLRWVFVHGSEKQRRKALATPADIYLINYEGLIWLTSWFEEEEAAGRPLPFDTINFDESSKMKSASARRFKLFKPHRDKFRRVTLMTGTPKPEGYDGLFSQVFLLDGGERLGRYISHFKAEHFTTNPWNRFDEELRPGHDKIIEEKIADIVLVPGEADQLSMPPILYNEVPIVLPPAIMERYVELEDELFTALESGGEVEALNEASLRNKCSQFTSGAVYEVDPVTAIPVMRADGKRKWNAVHDAKLDALADIIDDAQGQSILVAYEFKHELERLLKRWPKLRVLGGGGAAERKTIDDWNAGRIPLMAAHPASAGHGLNLQHGGHILVWLTIADSCELYQQMVKRLDRPGQLHTVVVHHIIARGTVDLARLAGSRSKGKSLIEFVNSVRAIRASRSESSLLPQ